MCLEVTLGFEIGGYVVAEGENVSVCVEVSQGALGRDVLLNIMTSDGESL